LILTVRIGWRRLLHPDLAWSRRVMLVIWAIWPELTGFDPIEFASRRASNAPS
jgi:hypothetical protein